MFNSPGSSSLFGTFALPTEDFTEKERPAPARPTVLEFPNYVPPCPERPLTFRHMKSLRKSLASVRKPSDVRDRHLAQFNIHLEQDVGVSAFVPQTLFGERPFLYDTDLTLMLAELGYENKDAFREVLRLPPLDTSKKPRLTYSRNFFASLEDMSHYWDSSADNYFEVPADKLENPTTTPLAQSISNSRTEDLVEQKPVKASLSVSSGRSPTTPSDLLAGTANSRLPDTVYSKHPPELQHPENLNHPQASGLSGTKMMYKGNRHGAGHQMPAGLRIAAVRSLLKMVIYKFNCRDYDVTARERLRIKDINISTSILMNHFSVARIPREVKQARARMVEGPIMSICCRPEVLWRQQGDPTTSKMQPGDHNLATDSGSGDHASEKFDLLREVGSMLHTAMQRAREGRSRDDEAKTMANTWWTSRPRWGGGPTKWGQMAYEIYEEEDPSWSPVERALQSEKRMKEEEQKSRIVQKPVQPRTMDINDLIAGSDNHRPKKKNRLLVDGEDARTVSKNAKGDEKRVVRIAPARKRWYEEWTKLRPNASLWDDKVIYKRIGGGEVYDEIFQVSSLNHHVALMKMTVHRSYIHWLEKGEVPDAPASIDSEPSTKSSQPDCVLQVIRSQWFDLFDIEQRKEFLTALWRVMCYINREVVPQAEYDKMKEAQSALSSADRMSVTD